MSRRTIGNSTHYNMSSNNNRPFDNNADDVDDEFRDAFLADSERLQAYETPRQPTQHTQFPSLNSTLNQNHMQFLPNGSMNPQNASSQFQWPIQYAAPGHMPTNISAYPSNTGYNPLSYDNQSIQGQAQAPQHYPGMRNLPQAVLPRSSTPNPSRMHHASRSVDSARASGSNQVICPVCSLSFINPSTLEDHMNNHSGSKPHACHGECGNKSCALTFPTRDALSTHQQKKDRINCENW
ncbi:hypothetical protein FRC14_006895 [Serendipita sp. 396]|nr:hypothetical protein FRC14_006895 [Serendipita sp. 396]